MPEGPEVATLVYYLNKTIINDTFKDMKILSGKYTKKRSKSTTIENYDKFKKDLPARLVSINCLGKFMYFEFYSTLSKKTWYLFMTLGLSGRVVVKSDYDSYTNIQKSDSTLDMDHARVKFTGEKTEFYFIDTRNFGTLHLFDDKSELVK